MELCRYKMIGGSFSQIVDGKRVKRKKGEIFKAYPSDVRAGRHQMECLDGEKEEETQFQLERPQVLKAVHKGGGRYNVEDEEGVVLNSRYLTKQEAKSMVDGQIFHDEENEDGAGTENEDDGDDNDDGDDDGDGDDDDDGDGDDDEEEDEV